jgi:hypothetical protein
MIAILAETATSGSTGSGADVNESAPNAMLGAIM